VPRVTVHLGSILSKKLGRGHERRLEISLQEGGTIADLTQNLKLELEPEMLLLAVNGRVARPETVLEDGDRVHLMMPISGG
jgi:sulfur carrier protein ThiS